MSEWRDFLCDDELTQLHRIESRMDADKADRRRLVNRAFARMARDKARREGIRAINERIQAAHVVNLDTCKSDNRASTNGER